MTGTPPAPGRAVGWRTSSRWARCCAAAATSWPSGCTSGRPAAIWRTRTSGGCPASWHVPLPRLGMRMAVPGGLGHARWFGGGPGEGYPDSRAAACLGRGESPVDALQTPYVRPQENGARPGVRWAELTRSDGTGLRIGGVPEFFFTARRWTTEELDAARHTTDLTPGERVWLHLDHAQHGLGSRSCGPGILPRHRLTAGPARFAFSRCGEAAVTCVRGRLAEGASVQGEALARRAPEAARREPAAVGDEQQVLGGAGEGGAGAVGPFPVVGVQRDTVQRGAEEPYGPGRDALQEDAQPVLGHTPVQRSRAPCLQGVRDRSPRPRTGCCGH